MRNFQDSDYTCKRVSTRFTKPCSPVFLDNYEQNKTKKILPTFVDIAKENVREKIQRKETLLELKLLEVFVSLKQKTRFLEVFIYNYLQSFLLQYKYNHITRKFVLLSKIYFKVYVHLNYCSRLFLDHLILCYRKLCLLHLNYLHTCLIS